MLKRKICHKKYNVRIQQTVNQLLLDANKVVCCTKILWQSLCRSSEITEQVCGKNCSFLKQGNLRWFTAFSKPEIKIFNCFYLYIDKNLQNSKTWNLSYIQYYVQLICSQNSSDYFKIVAINWYIFVYTICKYNRTVLDLEINLNYKSHLHWIALDWLKLLRNAMKNLPELIRYLLGSISKNYCD